MLRLIIILIIHPLTTRVVGAPQMISQPVPPFFPVLSCPLVLGELQTFPFPDVVFHLFLCLPYLLLPFTVLCKIVLARPDERET